MRLPAILFLIRVFITFDISNVDKGIADYISNIQSLIKTTLQATEVTTLTAFIKY
jgi:hypothetical protein